MAPKNGCRRQVKKLPVDNRVQLRYWAGVHRVLAIVLSLSWVSVASAESDSRPASPHRSCVHQLTTGDGLWVRNSKRSYGTKNTIQHLKSAALRVQKNHPKSHNVTVGDISYRGGGRMKPHLSHRQGLDADIGYYYRDGRFRKWFAKTSANQMDAKRQWTFVNALLETNEVQYIFMSYRLQRRLYKEAQRRGVSKKRLRRIFQWPRRWTHRVGIIRFERGHHTHMHVRFKRQARQ